MIRHSRCSDCTEKFRYYQGFGPDGPFLPFFFQLGSCSPRAQLRIPETNFAGAFGMFSMVSKIPRKSSLGSDMLPDFVGIPRMGAKRLHARASQYEPCRPRVLASGDEQNFNNARYSTLRPVSHSDAWFSLHL